MPRPKRRKRSEILSLAAVLAMPAVLAAIFPYSAVAFRPGPAAPRSEPSCAFVRLSPEAETKAMEKVRAALSVRKERIMDLTADLSLSTLPEDPPKAIVSEADITPLAGVPVPAGDFVPFPPSLASPEPEKMDGIEGKDRLYPFPREELLKIKTN